MQKQKQQQKNKKQRVPSAIVLGSQENKITEFLYLQSQFSRVQTDKLSLYISNQLVLIKPTGIPICKQQREQYFKDIELIFNLDYRSLTKLILIVTDADSGELICEISKILKTHRTDEVDILVINLFDVEGKEDPIQYNPISFEDFSFGETIQCYSNDDISDTIISKCQLNEKCNEITFEIQQNQIDDSQQDNQTTNNQAVQNQQESQIWSFIECLNYISMVFSLSNLRPRYQY